MWHLHNVNFVTLYENFPLKTENFNIMTVTKDSQKPVLIKYLYYLLFSCVITHTTQISMHTGRSPKIEFNHHKRTIVTYNSEQHRE